MKMPEPMIVPTIRQMPLSSPTCGKQHNITLSIKTEVPGQQNNRDPIHTHGFYLFLCSLSPSHNSNLALVSKMLILSLKVLMDTWCLLNAYSAYSAFGHLWLLRWVIASRNVQLLQSLTFLFSCINIIIDLTISAVFGSIWSSFNMQCHNFGFLLYSCLKITSITQYITQKNVKYILIGWTQFTKRRSHKIWR